MCVLALLALLALLVLVLFVLVVVVLMELLFPVNIVDALATALCILGTERGNGLLKTMPEVQVRWPRAGD